MWPEKNPNAPPQQIRKCRYYQPTRTQPGNRGQDGVASLDIDDKGVLRIESVLGTNTASTWMGPFVYQSHALKTLDISLNEIAEVGSKIKNLTRLSDLKIDQKKIKRLSKEIMLLPHLDSIDLSGNPLLDENLDSGIVGWFDKKFYRWRNHATDKELRDFKDLLFQRSDVRRPG